MNNILILGGVSEGYALARALADSTGFHTISSLAGRTHDPRPPVGETRIGGFGGIDGLRDFLAERSIRAVIDATHPFAATMGHHAAAACEQAEVPVLRLERPAWKPEPGDQWRGVADWEQAATTLQESRAKRVFLALGARELAPFSGLNAIWFLARTVTPPDPMPDFAQVKLLIARGPFTLDAERQLLQQFAIDTIVCRNSGGDGASAKLSAARELGIPVILRERPARPPLPAVASVAAAVQWLEQLAMSR